MHFKDEIDNDIDLLLSEIDNQDDDDRRKSLRKLIDKHVSESQADHMMGTKDLESIVNNSKIEYSNKAFPLRMADNLNDVSENDQRVVVFVEATVLHLNKIGCLRRVAKFNYRR